MISVTIRRSELRALGACSAGRELFASIAPKGVLHVQSWTQLHALWLATAYPEYSAWLIDSRAIPAIRLADANLAGAYLARATLAGAYLARANLADATIRMRQEAPPGWVAVAKPC